MSEEGQYSSRQMEYYSHGGDGSEEQTSHPNPLSSNVENVNVDFEIDIHRGEAGASSGAGSKPRPKTFEERMRTLAPHNPPPVEPRQSTAPEAAVQVQHQQKKTDASCRQEVTGYPVEDAVMRLGGPNGVSKDGLWLHAGSLRTLQGEEAICRRAGMVTDFVNVYCLVSFIMMTNRRILIKTVTTLFGINLHTVEESFQYNDLQHVAVRRVTNFRYLLSGIGAFFLTVIFLSLSALFWFYALLGVVTLLSSVFLIYWFLIFYNTNTLVLDFSKSDSVGSWFSGKGKGSHVTKPILLRIDECFEIMHHIYDHSKTIFDSGNI